MLSELRALEDEKLKEMFFKLKIKLVEYKFQLSQAQLKNTSLIGITKKAIAQVLTLFRERGMRFSNKDWSYYISKSEKENELKSRKG